MAMISRICATFAASRPVPPGSVTVPAVNPTATVSVRCRGSAPLLALIVAASPVIWHVAPLGT